MMMTTTDKSVSTSASCRVCPHANDRLAASRCRPGDACVRAHSGRQMDRFFSRNPDLAARYRHDSFWERRAVAARYLPPELMLELINDDDELVRYAVVAHLPPALLELLAERFANDPSREVRTAAAKRLPAAGLHRFIGDSDCLVRAHTARRLPPPQLIQLRFDPDYHVRRIVAERLPPEQLVWLANDSEIEVRRAVAERAAPRLAAAVLGFDPDWTVRYAAVARAPAVALRQAAQADSEIEVRVAADERLQQLERQL